LYGGSISTSNRPTTDKRLTDKSGRFWMLSRAISTFPKFPQLKSLSV
jgi:hypothetical protein